MSLDKVGKEKDKLRDLISQLKHCINDLKISTPVLKENFSFCSFRAEIAETQTQVSSWEWLNYNPNWIPNLAGVCY